MSILSAFDINVSVNVTIYIASMNPGSAQKLKYFLIFEIRELV